MTPEQLSAATGARIDRATAWLPYITEAMGAFEIDTPLRQAMFLAQIGHESGGLKYATEIWGPTDAQKRYEGRKDLGNTQPGDGSKYRGRGLIQVTGRANYTAVSTALLTDFVSQPELLATHEHAAMSAAWFWQSRGLNADADAGDIVHATRIINGGTNGLEERKRLYQAALKALA